jgi:hypothetical protein
MPTKIKGLHSFIKTGQDAQIQSIYSLGLTKSKNLMQKLALLRLSDDYISLRAKLVKRAIAQQSRSCICLKLMPQSTTKQSNRKQFMYYLRVSLKHAKLKL